MDVFTDDFVQFSVHNNENGEDAKPVHTLSQTSNNNGTLDEIKINTVEPVVDEFSSMKVSFNATPFNDTGVENDVPVKPRSLNHLINNRASNYELPNEQHVPHKSHSKSVRFANAHHSHKTRTGHSATPKNKVPITHNAEDTLSSSYGDWANKDKIVNPSNSFVREVNNKSSKHSGRHAQNMRMDPSSSMLGNPRKKRQVQRFAHELQSDNDEEMMMQDDPETRAYQSWLKQSQMPNSTKKSMYKQQPPPKKRRVSRPPPSHRRPMQFNNTDDDSDTDSEFGSMSDENDNFSKKRFPKRTKRRLPKHKPSPPPSDSSDNDSSDNNSDSDDDTYKFDTFEELRGLPEEQQRAQLLKRKNQLERDGVVVEGVFDMTPVKKMMEKIEEAENQQQEDFYLEMGEMALIGMFLGIEKFNLVTGEFLKIRGVSKDVFEDRRLFRQPLRRIIRMYVCGGVGSTHPVLQLGMLICGTLVVKAVSSHFDTMFKNMGTSNPMFNMMYNYMMGNGMEGSDFGNMVAPMMKMFGNDGSGGNSTPVQPQQEQPSTYNAQQSQPQQPQQNMDGANQLTALMQGVMQGFAPQQTDVNSGNNTAMNNTRDRNRLVEPEGGYKYEPLDLKLRGNVQPGSQSAV